MFVDSPMSIKATNLLDDFASQHKLSEKECFEIFDDTKLEQSIKNKMSEYNSQITSNNSKIRALKSSIESMLG